MVSLKKALVIVGPTASGKTVLSIALARRCNGEIVSADSRQIFKFMDIGTAKPTREERESAIHHLVDELMPDLQFSAGEFAQKARPIIASIFSKGRTPIVTGGSGLYVKALVDGMFEGNYKDLETRLLLKKRAHSEGLDSLFRELQQVDPDAAERIHPNDAKRIIRALEVFHLAGRPLTVVQSEKNPNPSFPNSWWGIRWPREKLFERIGLRVDQMISQGLIREVLRLKEMGYNARLNSMDSVGYKEVFSYLNGKLSKDGMIALINRNTRRFAKKQMTWLRSNKRIQWIDIHEENVDWDGWAEFILEKERAVS